MNNRSFGLDVVRSFSVWMVLVGHSAYWFSPEKGGMYQSFVQPLLLGVEPFFVLGGFLAAISFARLRAKRNSNLIRSDYLNYINRRWVRTLPNYFLFLAIYTLAFYLVKDDFTFDYSYLIFSQNLFWLSPNFFSVSWSLAAQEWFYVALPAFMMLSGLAIKRLDNITVDPVLAGAVSLIIVSVLARYAYLHQNDVYSLEGELRRIAALRLDSIAIGVLVGYSYFVRKTFYKHHKTKLLIISAAIIVLLSFLRREPFFYQNTIVHFIYYPLFSCVLAMCMPWFYELRWNPRGIVSRAIESTSKWSYSIYLSHVLFLDTLYLTMTSVGVKFDKNLTTVLIFLSWLVFTYVTSFFIYKRFEMPIVAFFHGSKRNFNR